ncbi:MAG TPA: hypothetical protein VFQ73_19090 [Flavisolibacter sp.]|nr:hypothetical protein [Flavisolibacter sp.]
MASLSKVFMKQKANNKEQTGKHEHPLAHEIGAKQKAVNEAAHEEAIHDIEDDPDMSAPGPNDDLDEGETARLGEDKTDLV